MKKHMLLIGLGMALTLYFMGGATNKFYTVPLDRNLDAIVYDFKLHLTMPHSKDNRIVILDIDEKSLKEEGRWPWRRDRLALLMNKLFDRYHIAVAGFDIVFAEKDDSSGLDILQAMGRNQLKGDARFQAALQRLRPQLEYDEEFAGSLKGRKVVLGYYFNVNEEGGKNDISGALPEPTFPPGSFEGHPITFEHEDSYGGNLPELQKNAAGAGHFNPLVDPDGTVRRIPMIVQYNGAYYESLSLAVVRTLFGNTTLEPRYKGDQEFGYSGLEWLELKTPRGNLQIPVDQQVGTLIPYRGRRGSFRYISVTDVLHDRISPDELRGKIVLIGTTAPGLMDLRSTPVETVFPGVEVHANMISGILDQDIKQRPPYFVGAEIALLLLLGGVLSLLLPLLGPARAIVAAGGTLLALAGFDIWMWQSADLDLPIASSAMLIAMLFALNMSFGYFFESRIKHKITSLFGQYVPAEVVEEMSKNPESVSMEGESREVTIMFSDVRGFTSISEGLDPKELSKLMNEFLTPLSRVIYKHRGTIDKYIGDCIMAFWGAPLHDPNHARNAVMAGMEMLRVLHELQKQFQARDWPNIRIGIGINTGRVSVGNMGSEVRLAYTVMGDSVNLASRIETITKQYRVDFLVSETTKAAVPGLVYREIDLVRVKGKEEPIALYEPIGLPDEVAPEKLYEIKLYHQALRLYRKQDWDQAELQLLNLQKMSPNNRLYQIYTDRIAYFRSNPPGADWDGAHTADTK
jgi:adenylate cyclase